MLRARGSAFRLRDWITKAPPWIHQDHWRWISNELGIGSVPKRRQSFEAYIRDRIAPQIQSGDVVIVDGLGAHRTPGARVAVEERGAKFWFLPPYSPDLSPVERCGSKVKEAIRASAPRSVPQVYRAMGRAIGQVTDRDARGWFQHAGYIRRARYTPPTHARETRGRFRRHEPPGDRSRGPP